MSDVNKFIEPFGEGFTPVSEVNSLCSTLKGVMEKTWDRWENERKGESKGDLVIMEKSENERKLKEKDFFEDRKLDLYIWLKNVGVNDYQLWLIRIL